MFQTCEVKMAKIDAASRPSSEPWNNPMKNVTVADRKPRTGTACRTSRRGISTFSARRLRAAVVAYTKVNPTEMPSAMTRAMSGRRTWEVRRVGRDAEPVTRPRDGHAHRLPEADRTVDAGHYMAPTSTSTVAHPRRPTRRASERPA